MPDELFSLLVLPIGLGLLGFVEPCSVGTSLLFLNYLEGRSPATRISQTLVFTLTRAVVIGLLGVVAVLVGTVFVGFQKGAWAVMGALYVALGIAYLTGYVDKLKRSFGPGFARLSDAKGAVTLAILFGLNIPACAGPLLAALLGSAALSESGNAARGFVMLGAFGLALSLPIAVAVLWSPGRKFLERVGSLSQRVPKVIGILFILLGAWSIRFALVAQVI